MVLNRTRGTRRKQSSLNLNMTSGEMAWFITKKKKQLKTRKTKQAKKKKKKKNHNKNLHYQNVGKKYMDWSQTNQKPPNTSAKTKIIMKINKVKKKYYWVHSAISPHQHESIR